MKPIYFILAILLLASSSVAGQQGGRTQSPASQRPPETLKPQTYPAELVKAGQARFTSECGFCHGRDAAGGETGPDLTRSVLVAEDFRGDKIMPLIRSGRVDKGMPAFTLSEADLDAIVAFIHDQKAKSESLGGGRRTVDPEDLDTGNREAGEKYFNGTGNCTKCHSATGDLANIGSRLRGLQLLQRMLYPANATAAKATVTLASGEMISGRLAARDEFTIGLIDAAGVRRTWSTNDVKFTIDDPLEAHFEQLGKYSDDDMHNVYAYLQSLR
jgi:cytochrome c oxidase cbb3-type subunit 3